MGGLTIEVSDQGYDIDVVLTSTVLFNSGLVAGEKFLHYAGTPVAGQIPVFTSEAIVAGFANLTFDGTSLSAPMIKVDHIAENSLNHGIVFDNQINLDDAKNIGTFVSGFVGSGWKLEYTGGLASMTLDNLTVRRKMSVYELEIREINHIGGSILISVADGKVESFTGTGPYNLYFDTNGGADPIMFGVGDFVRAQIWTGSGTDVFEGSVTYVGTDYITITAIITSDVPWIGMKLVQVGHPTIASRQNMIYLTAADDNNPYIDMLAGVDDGIFAGHQKLRIGNLTGITDATLSPSGYGLYAQNVFLSGKIVANAGYIGGTGGWAITTGSLIAGADATRIELDTTTGIHMGATLFADAPFSVTPSGAFVAITGLVGGWTIAAQGISHGTPHYGNGYSAAAADITLASDGSIHAKNFYVNVDGSTNLAGAILPHLFRKKASANARNADTQEVSASNTYPDYILRRKYTFTNGIFGTIRVTFELKKTETGTGGDGYARLYHNGVFLGGTTHVSVLGAYVVKTEDVTHDFAVGDTIELWLYAQNADVIVFADTFTLSYDDDDSGAVAATVS